MSAAPDAPHSDSPTPGAEPSAAAEDRARKLRVGVYAVMIAVAVGGMLGRIAAVNSVDVLQLERYLERQGRDDWQKQRPFLSANDRSRWCTVRALVEHGTYAIDEIVREPNWDTIDMVKHDDQGHEAPEPEAGHLYSSKPTLFPTLMAGEYWLIHRATGKTLGTHPSEIGRAMVVTINVLPLVVYFVLLARLAERYGTSDWGRIFVFACGAFGTFLSTFVVVINNHLPAAVCAMIALYAMSRIWSDGERRYRYFWISGLFAALAASNDLPALALVALVGLGLLFKAPRETLAGYLPGTLLVVAAFFGTNYLAHHSLIPPYGHRQRGDNWYDYQYVRDGRVRDSYWSIAENRSPIDQGEPSPKLYALHALVGHHGVFSLTPVWLLSVAGMLMWCLGRDGSRRGLGALVLVVTVVCLGFYLTMPMEDRNYGGMTSGFRWAFWMAPLWLVAMLPAADAMARGRWSRGVAAVLLGFSVLSVSYPTWNPWTHPWLLNYLLYMDWVGLGPR